ncbi:MAG TPA: CoA transferase [Dehalococcoidia bacterium]|nr:CoA transferase [Dehalococcoidia bacterium]
MAQALQGVTVVELVDGFWAGLGTTFMADFGARVVKVTAGASPLDGLAKAHRDVPPEHVKHLYHLVGRNKLGVALDLSGQEGQDLLRRLATAADVFVSDWPRRDLEALALDYESLRARREDIVYVTASGFGQKGPDADLPNLEELAAARIGLMPILPQPGRPPVYPGHGQIYASGLLLLGASIALWHRQRTGEGQWVDVSLLAAGMYGATLDVQAYLAMRSERFLRPISRYDAGNPMSGTYYLTSDGRWLTLTMPDTDRYWPRLAPLVGLDPADPRFDTHEKRCEVNRLELIRLLEEAFRRAPSDYWKEAMEEHDLSGDIIEDYSYPANDEFARLNGYVLSLDHPLMGDLKLLGFPIYMSETPASLDRLAPCPHQHTAQALRSLLGLSEEEVVALQEKGVIRP